MIGGPIMGGGLPRHRRISLQGQSNAMGVAPRSEIASLSDTGLSAYDTGTFDRVYIWNISAGAYQKLQPGTNNSAYTTGTFGAEFGLAVRWMRETSNGNLFIDKHYGDGQPISYFQDGQTFFADEKTIRASANAWLTANGFRVWDAGWLWVQGEADRAQTQAYYESALTTYINSRISNGLLRSAAKRILAQCYPGSGQYGATVAAAKTAYAAANSGTTVTIDYANYFNADNVHLNARGMLQLGYDAYEKFFNRAHIAA